MIPETRAANAAGGPEGRRSKADTQSRQCGSLGGKLRSPVALTPLAISQHTFHLLGFRTPRAFLDWAVLGPCTPRQDSLRSC